MKLFLLIVVIATCVTGSAQTHQLVKKWESDSVFKVPESVLFDPDHGVLYVTNIEGKDSWAKDGLGSLGKMDVNGRVIDAEWITGFNAPKGMGIYHHALYVADIDRVVVVDLHAGKIATSIEVPGAIALNDLSIDPSGVIYVSDSKGKKLYRIAMGKPTVYLDSLKGPNGVLVKDGQLFVLDNGGMYKVNADKTLSLVVDGMEGGTDGIEKIEDEDYIVSTWAGVVYYVDARAKTKEVLLDGRKAKINSADIGFDPKTKTVFIPTFWKNSVVAYEVK
jgi:DNA-binding beta-propeller fold protein YncE